MILQNIQNEPFPEQLIKYCMKMNDTHINNQEESCMPYYKGHGGTIMYRCSDANNNKFLQKHMKSSCKFNKF